MSWTSWAEWGSAVAVPTIADTVIYGYSGTGVLSELADDQSQLATDLTVGTGSIYETDSSRMLQNDERTIDWVMRLHSTDTGWLWSYGGQRLVLTADTLSVVVNSSAIFSVTLGAGASRTLWIVSWAMEPNPGGSGASSRRSVLTCYDVATDTIVRGEGRHAVPTATLTTGVFWAQNSAGTNAFTGDRRGQRFSVAYHSGQEQWEELIDATADPGHTLETRRELPVPPKSTTIGDDGNIAGPVAILAAGHSLQADLRLVGPLVSAVFSDPIVLSGDRLSPGIEFCLEDPASNARYAHLQYCWYVPVPPSVNRWVARVFIQQYRLSLIEDDDTIEIGVQSSNKRAYFVDGLPDYRRVIDVVERTADDGDGDTGGTWVTLGPAEIVRDDDDWTWLCLTFRVTDPGGGGGGDIDDQLWRIKAVSIDAGFVQSENELPQMGGL